MLRRLANNRRLSPTLAVLTLLLMSTAWTTITARTASVLEQASPLVIVENGLELTVGNGGDFSSLVEALAFASGLRHRYNPDREGITIRILEGFTLSEQIHLYNTDLSFIRITGDAPVPVDTTGFENADDDRGSAPLFNAQRGSRTPKIDVIFEQVAGDDAVGLLLNRTSSGVVTPNGGFIGFRDGATVNNGSTLSGRFATFQGSRWGVHARHMSDATLRSADITGGEIGVWARRAARADVRAANLSGEGGEGIRADNVSLVEAHGATIEGRDIAINAFRGGQVSALGITISNGDVAFQVREGGFIYAHELSDMENVATLFSVTPNTFSEHGVIFTSEDSTELN